MIDETCIPLVASGDNHFTQPHRITRVSSVTFGDGLFFHCTFGQDNFVSQNQNWARFVLNTNLIPPIPPRLSNGPYLIMTYEIRSYYKHMQVQLLVIL